MTCKFKTLEQIISEFGVPPICGCSECQILGRRVNIKPDKDGSYARYRLGYPKFLPGHGNKGEGNGMYGKKRPDHSERMKGPNNPMFGNPREDLQIKFKGEGNPMFDQVPWNKDKHWSPEVIEKLKYQKSQEHKDKLSEVRIGKFKGDNNVMSNPEIRKKHLLSVNTPENKIKIGIGVSKRWEDPEYKRLHSGENCSGWKGGVSFAPYCPKFNESKKEEIRNKYNRKCIICGKSECNNIIDSGINRGKIKKLHVHHVDYNKNQGCSGHVWKLTPLCMSCHGKTTSGNRQFWENKICEILKLNGE